MEVFELVDKLKELLKLKFNVPVVPSDWEKKGPAYPYVSYTLTTPLEENRGTWGEGPGGEVFKQFSFTISFTVQAETSAECVSLALKLHDYLEARNYELSRAGIVCYSCGAITTRDNLLTYEYERRAGFDAKFYIIRYLDKELVPSAPGADEIELNAEVNNGNF